MTTEIESKRLRLNGILVINKPPLLSSMGAISRVRGRSRGVRTGHAGTLDPLATGVLVVGLGRATKRLDFNWKPRPAPFLSGISRFYHCIDESSSKVAVRSRVWCYCHSLNKYRLRSEGNKG